MRTSLYYVFFSFVYKLPSAREYVQVPAWSSSKTLKLPVSKHSLYVTCHVLINDILYNIKFIYFSFFFQEYKTQLKMVDRGQITFSLRDGYMRSKSWSFDSMTSGVMTLPMKRMEPGEGRGSD